MKTLLINPPDPYLKKDPKHYPLGLGYLATILNQRGDECQILDMSAIDQSSLEEKIKSFQPSVVGISVLSTTLPEVEKLVPRLRSVFNGPLIAGGGIEKGESPDEAGNEIEEEVNLDIKEKRLVFYRVGYNDKDTYLTLIFFCKAEGKLKIPKGEKHVRNIELIKSAEELKKLRFYPKYIADKIFNKLPEKAEFLGKFRFPED